MLCVALTSQRLGTGAQGEAGGERGFSKCAQIQINSAVSGSPEHNNVEQGCRSSCVAGERERVKVTQVGARLTTFTYTNRVKKKKTRATLVSNSSDDFVTSCLLPPLERKISEEITAGLSLRPEGKGLMFRRRQHVGGEQSKGDVGALRLIKIRLEPTVDWVRVGRGPHVCAAHREAILCPRRHWHTDPETDCAGSIVWIGERGDI